MQLLNLQGTKNKLQVLISINAQFENVDEPPKPVYIALEIEFVHKAVKITSQSQVIGIEGRDYGK